VIEMPRLYVTGRSMGRAATTRASRQAQWPSEHVALVTNCPGSPATFAVSAETRGWPVVDPDSGELWRDAPLVKCPRRGLSLVPRYCVSPRQSCVRSVVAPSIPPSCICTKQQQISWVNGNNTNLPP
jgi:hypothetical protein